jgi:hypothetical protein
MSRPSARGAGAPTLEYITELGRTLTPKAGSPDRLAVAAAGAQRDCDPLMWRGATFAAQRPHNHAGDSQLLCEGRQ